MGCNQKSLKTSYYKLIQKEIKKSFDAIQTNEFNKTYSIQMKKLVSEKKIKKQRKEIVEEIINWKIYLLDQLYTKNSKSWKYHLYNFITSKEELNNQQIYFLENDIFLMQFIFSSFPQFYIAEPDRKQGPILSLFDQDELKSYTIRAKKKKDKLNKNKKEESKAIELMKIEFDESVQEDNEDNKDNEDNDYINVIEDIEDDKEDNEKRRLTLGTAMEGQVNIESENRADDKTKIKYNSYQIREHISLIRKQLENKDHPIHQIINQFSEYYKIKISKGNESFSSESSKEYDYSFVAKKTDKAYLSNRDNLEKKKEKIIKDIQDFIEIISVALKLFYAKTINYESFIGERDEFFNLVSFILFKEKDFYQRLFEFFELSNKQKYEQLEKKKEAIGKISTIEAGITIKFCLDESTKKLKNNPNLDIKTLRRERRRAAIIDYFERLDYLQQRYISFNIDSNDPDCFDQSVSYQWRISKNESYIENKKEEISIIANYDEIKQKNKTKSHRPSVSTYKEFSDQYNNESKSVMEKYIDDLNENPSQLDIDLKKNKNKTIGPNEPYAEAIEYITTMKDYYTPLDKLTIIALTSVIITDYVDKFWKGVEGLDSKYLIINADELMSIYLYIVYNMNLSSIYTQLDFIKYFTGIATKQSMIGYYYTTVEGCLNFIMSVKKKEDFITEENNY